jgi:hypothetical protein
MCSGPTIGGPSARGASPGAPGMGPGWELGGTPGNRIGAGRPPQQQGTGRLSPFNSAFIRARNIVAEAEKLAGGPIAGLALPETKSTGVTELKNMFGTQIRKKP